MRDTEMVLMLILALIIGLGLGCALGYNLPHEPTERYVQVPGTLTYVRCK